MPGKEIENLQGLSNAEILSLRTLYGENNFTASRSSRFFEIIKSIVAEPMFILLAIACLVYFILGETAEGFMMASAIILVSAISFYQEVKSTKALEKLQHYTAPLVTVTREGRQQTIKSAELVPGDIVQLEEGMKIPADAVILQSNDFTINESIITGESLPAEKNDTIGKNNLYQGTTINSGKCIAKVTATGNRTELAKIGKAVDSYNAPKTLLQIQLNRFVNKFALFGLAAFFIIFLVNYLRYGSFITSLLFALTLAMSAVPEEIPVAFSSFMALGAYKMSRLGIISRQPQVIENLGAVTVLCLDKTGTITENKMEVKAIYDYKQDHLIDLAIDRLPQKNEILFFAALASETNPFDPMEIAILKACDENNCSQELQHYKMTREYPLEGQPPMMTHVYSGNGKFIATAKGSPERILSACRLGTDTVEKIMKHTKELGGNGYRVLGVCHAEQQDDEFPQRQDDFKWQFSGLLALYDPPRRNINKVLKQIAAAQIDIKILTGDFHETALNIAKQIGLVNNNSYITGADVMQMHDDELDKIVGDKVVYARMFPDAKVKVINALKRNGEIVAMTGDGVNDGPALKLSDVGIAMGKKGTETAKIAADLILSDDNLERIVTAISEGRKIFENLVKAIRYIISIHIPIILTASLPVVLDWKYPNIFTPIHVIFLELIMGPTCSVFFEREPVEANLMLKPARNRTKSMFTLQELLISVVQGLVISAAVLTIYYLFMKNQTIEQTRAIVFFTLIISNVFLTFADRSFTKTLFYTSRYKNNLAPVIFIISSVFLALLYFVTPVQHLFGISLLSPAEFWLCVAVAFASVMWFEIYKLMIQPGRPEKGQAR